MACTTLHASGNQNAIDIEDIYGKNSNFSGIEKITDDNIEIYKDVVKDLFSWVQENKENDNIKNLFAKRLAAATRQYNKIYIKKSLLVFIYRKMIAANEIETSLDFWRLIQKSPSRNISGITSVTLLTSPFPDGQSYSCKHDCFYCPNEPGMPRSYLRKEPAVARADRNEFDATRQTIDRLDSLLMCGHEIDKLEFIIEGGTYTEYPVDYLERFHRDIVYSCNTYFDKEKRDPLTIHEEVEFNRTARVRIIGICIETRPDAIDSEWLHRFRQWGVTRVQLGVQHLDDDILKKVNRGHTVQDAVDAVNFLKDNCFKVDIHMMPDLPNSTPSIDKDMFKKLFTTDFMRVDQVKIYPCEITPWTKIQKWYQEGKYRPYSEVCERDLFDVVKYAMEICPPYVRLPRVIRDIPTSYIQGGNAYPNLRQMLYQEMEKEGKYSMDIRNRECGRHPKYKVENADYVTREYSYVTYNNNRIATDYFISAESPDRKVIFGFLRLRIPHNRKHFPVFDCLDRTALIRELHVYGEVVPVGFSKENVTQHKGVGTKLLKIAEEHAYYKGNLDRIAVISGIGVKGFYEKHNYYSSGIQDGDFLIKDISGKGYNMYLKVHSVFFGILCFILLTIAFVKHVQNVNVTQVY